MVTPPAVVLSSTVRCSARSLLKMYSASGLGRDRTCAAAVRRSSYGITHRMGQNSSSSMSSESQPHTTTVGSTARCATLKPPPHTSVSPRVPILPSSAAARPMASRAPPPALPLPPTSRPMAPSAKGSGNSSLVQRRHSAVNSPSTARSHSTYSGAMHCCPQLRLRPHTHCLAATDTSAEAVTNTGFLPPSSSAHGVSLAAALCATMDPTRDDPVKKMKSNFSSSSAVMTSTPSLGMAGPTTLTARGST
mmetsp:Transcript_17043/g.41896  ORF Transcript_17043/g.41896 Transcript_17043/m.41896 type:complete len:249 (-) Transcript_17043:751-1497(-)